MPAKINLKGQHFGRLTAINVSGKKNGAILWNCLCDCGGITQVTTSCLRQGTVISCGCASDTYHQNEKTHSRLSKATHQTPPAHHSTRSSWLSMRQRCLYPYAASYPLYGGAGIKICQRWDTFKQFLIDMGLRPESTSLDRIDSTKNYEPNNCRWATRTQQNRNRQGVILTEPTAGEIRWLTDHGHMHITIAEHYKVHPATVSQIAHNQRWKDAPPVKPPEDLIAKLPRRALAYNPDLPFNK